MGATLILIELVYVDWIQRVANQSTRLYSGMSIIRRLQILDQVTSENHLLSRITKAIVQLYLKKTGGCIADDQLTSQMKSAGA